MSVEEGYIDGIFNYCDRWCERCPFTSRCRNFAMQAEAFPNAESRDIRNQAFWDALQGVFASTIQMVRKTATRHGIDLDAIDCEEFLREEGERQERARNHPLVRSAETYAAIVDDWFEQHEVQVEQKAEELNSELRLGLENLDPEAEAVEIGDAVDVVRWYQYQIAVKLVRALARDDGNELTAEIARHDANGSAKVALLGMDRSLAAWSILGRAFADEADSLLDLMVRLDRLRRGTEAALPEARAFARPGFDTSTA
jgi:hypothetical protein